jgi:hypothetical protein
MTWLEEDRRRYRPSSSGREPKHAAWTSVRGQFTLTVVPSLRGSWRNQWIWTVRDTMNGFAMLADGIAPSREEGCKAAIDASTRLVEPLRAAAG